MSGHSADYDAGAVAARLRFLAAARREYFHGSEPETSTDLDRMDSAQLMIWTQVRSAEQLANIIEGTDDAKGWLPSWRWSEWESLSSVLPPGEGRV